LRATQKAIPEPHCNARSLLNATDTLPTFDNELLKDDSIKLSPRNSRDLTTLSSLSEVKVMSNDDPSAYTSKSPTNSVSSQDLICCPASSSASSVDSNSREWRTLVRELFMLNNIKAIYVVSVKKRENQGRFRLWAVYLLYTLVIIVSLGCSIIMVSFVEHTYGWTASHYQYIDGYGKLALGLVSTFVLHFLSKVSKVPDTKIIMVGIFCAFFLNSFRGNYRSALLFSHT
jgi:hypothetical protein